MLVQVRPVNDPVVEQVFHAAIEKDASDFGDSGTYDYVNDFDALTGKKLVEYVYRRFPHGPKEPVSIMQFDREKGHLRRLDKFQWVKDDDGKFQWIRVTEDYDSKGQSVNVKTSRYGRLPSGGGNGWITKVE